LNHLVSSLLCSLPYSAPQYLCITEVIRQEITRLGYLR